MNNRWAIVAGLGVAISAAVACTSEDSEPHPGSPVEGAGGDRVAGGGAPGDASQAGHSSDLGGGGAGRGGGEETQGGTGGVPDAMCGVAQAGAGAGGYFGDGHLTNRLPDEPFVLERMPAEHEAYDESVYPTPGYVGPGPWMLQLEPDGAGFSGHVVLFDTSAVDKVALVPEGDHYRFTSKATLVNYTYAADVVPGICVDREAKLSLLDDDGDCVADRLVLSGEVLSLGRRGGDYDEECGEEYYPIRIEGLPLSQSQVKPQLEATGDPLRPVLRVPAMYTQGTATLETESGVSIDAEALAIDEFIYGFRADVGLVPGSKATWHLRGTALAQSGSQTRDVPVTFADWPLVDDGTFETWDETWTQKDQLRRNNPDFAPPISGEHSLALEGGGTVASIRFVQPAGKTKLRFLADEKSFTTHPVDWIYGLAIDYAALGEAAVSAVPSVTNVCEAYPAYCNCDAEQKNCERELFDYSVDVAAAAEPRELLLRFKNGNADWPSTSDPILIDDLRFE